MGFPENKKLAKDINAVNTECADRLGALMTQMSGRMDTANRILEGIAAQEDRYIYRPSTSEGDIVLAAQSASYEATGDIGDSKKEFVLPNTFDALYDGEVTICTSASWSQVGGSFACGSYLVKQIYPVEVEIISGSLNPGAGSTSGSKSTSANFSVVKGARYQIILTLWSTYSKGNHGSASAGVSIRSIVQFIEGDGTKFYYPAEGAPAIWSDSGTYELTGNGSGNRQSVIEDFFLSDLDGAVIVSFDVETYGVSSSEYAYFALLPDISDWRSVNYGSRAFSGSELGAIASTNSKASFVTTVEKGKQYSLLFYLNYSQSLTISNISVSAIKTATAPITVPFVSVDEPIACTYNFNNSDIQGYILKKLPESIYDKNCNYLIAMQNDVYPGNYIGYANLVFFNMNTMSPDYYVGYEANDSDWVARNSNILGEFSANNIFAVAAVNGEICVCATQGNNHVSLTDLVNSCPPVSATLY